MTGFLRRKTESDISIRIDNSAVKLENKRLKIYTGDEIDRLHGQQLRRKADKSFDIKEAKREADIIMNQAKLIKGTQGLWEEILMNKKSTNPLTRPKSTATTTTVANLANEQKPVEGRTRRLGVVQWTLPSELPVIANKSEESLLIENHTNLTEESTTIDKSLPIASTPEITKVVNGGGAAAGVGHPGIFKTSSPGGGGDSESEEEENLDDEDEPDMGHRQWLFEMKIRRPLSAFLPLEQIIAGGRLEVPNKERAIKSAAPGGHHRDTTLNNRDFNAKNSSNSSKTRRSLSAGRKKSGKSERSFQHLKELAHIDNIAKARYTDSRQKLLLLRAEQLKTEEKQLQLKIQQFYSRLDELVKNTKEALKGKTIEVRHPPTFF